MRLKISLTIWLVLISIFSNFAQDSTNGDWKAVSSPKNDLSVLMPADFLVHNDEGKYRAYGYHDQASFKVEMQPTGNAKALLDRMRHFSMEAEAQISRFTIGNFDGDAHYYEKEKVFTMSIYAASSKGFYTIWVSSLKGQTPITKKFLDSIKLDNQFLTKQQNPTSSANETSISLSALKTSPAILEALNRKNTRKPVVRKALPDEKKALEEDTNKYSRPFVILTKPRAGYTDNARENGVRGTVKLRVLFGADGQIWEIVIIDGLKGGLDEQAVNAAKQIKFLPAEIDGKPASVTKFMQYSFNIY